MPRRPRCLRAAAFTRSVEPRSSLFRAVFFLFFPFLFFAEKREKEKKLKKEKGKKRQKEKKKETKFNLALALSIHNKQTKSSTAKTNCGQFHYSRVVKWGFLSVAPHTTTIHIRLLYRLVHRESGVGYPSTSSNIEIGSPTVMVQIILFSKNN